MEGDSKGNFSPKGSLTRGEAAKLFDNIHEELLKNQGYIINVGIVEKIDITYQSIDNIRTENRDLRVKNDDNTLLNILSEETNSEVLNKGFIVIKDGKLLLPKDIKAYNYIKYYINPNGEAILVHILEDKPSEIEGFIEEVDIEEGFVSMKDYNDRSFKLKLSPGAKVTINDQWAEAKDLLYGQEVTAKLVNGNIVDIKGYLDIGEGGYIHPGERIYIGKVLYINQRDSKVTIIEYENEHEFIIEPYTPVIKDGSNIGLKGIKEGDIIRLEFDQYEGNIPIKAYVAEPDRQIVNLYKATVEQFNAGRNELILGGVSYYDHTKWKSSSQSLKLPLGNDSEIYINGRKITKELLPSYLGREAYIATKDNYGKEETLKLVLKNGYEKKYYNSIQEIAFGDRKLKVDYNEVNFDDSTIIVKDGKLIHPYNLQEDDDIFLIAQGVDQYTAAFISIEGIADTGLIVYRGRIEEITQYGFDLDNFDILEGTNWDYSSREREFNISEDTKIIDTRNDDIKEVSVDEFTNSRFLKDRYREDNY